MHPSIDHSILSPSGRCSKRARKAAMDREAARLFPPGSNLLGPEPVTPEEAKRRKVSSLREAAQDLKDLAARGMSVRKFTKAAERFEAEAAALEMSA